MNTARRRKARRLRGGAALLATCSLAASFLGACGESAKKPEARDELDRRRANLNSRMDEIAAQAARETVYKVALVSPGERREDVLAALVAHADMSEADAASVLDQAPSLVAAHLTADEAEDLRRHLADAGATVEVVGPPPKPPAPPDPGPDPAPTPPGP